MLLVAIAFEYLLPEMFTNILSYKEFYYSGNNSSR